MRSLLRGAAEFGLTPEVLASATKRSVRHSSAARLACEYAPPFRRNA